MSIPDDSPFTGISDGAESFTVAAVIPEPGTMVLVALGGCLGLMRRRRA